MNNIPIKVLVIDDEPPIRKLLRMRLSTQGYAVVEAQNGKIALELLAQSPALIILDLGLPDIQGIDLLRMIRDRDNSVPVVVLSSRGDEAVKVQALDLGADDYLTKPFGMDELFARMRAALRHQLLVQGELRCSGPVIYPSIWSAVSSESQKGMLSCRRKSTSCCASWFSTPARC
jgi:two-component system, OmpR family, KDP operon response regulator KdpE